MEEKKENLEASPKTPPAPKPPVAPKPKMNKTAFILKQPLTMAAKEVVALAKTSGFTISEHYVYNVRDKARTAANKPGAKAKAAAAVKTVAVGAAAPKKAAKPVNRMGPKPKANKPVSKPALKPKVTKPAIKAGPKPKKDGTIAAFVLKHPLTMSAKEIVSRGNILGLNIHEDYVHKARRKARKAAGIVSRPGPKTKVARKAAPKKVAKAVNKPGPKPKAAICKPSPKPKAAPKVLAPKPVVASLDKEFATAVINIGLHRAEEVFARIRSRILGAL